MIAESLTRGHLHGNRVLYIICVKETAGVSLSGVSESPGFPCFVDISEYISVDDTVDGGFTDCISDMLADVLYGTSLMVRMIQVRT